MLNMMKLIEEKSWHIVASHVDWSSVYITFPVETISGFYHLSPCSLLQKTYKTEV